MSTWSITRPIVSACAESTRIARVTVRRLAALRGMTAPRLRSISMTARGFLVVAIAAVGLAAPAAANADDLYVTAGAGATTCAQDDPCSLPQAITVADIVSNPDKIHVVGSLDYSGAVDLSNSPIDLIG